MIYYDTNIYDLMYAGSIIKIKMRKSHSFYRVQLNLLMRARRSYVLITTFINSSEALQCNCAHEYAQVRRKHHKVERP